MKNKIVDYTKALSVVSVICAHCNLVPETAGVLSRYSSLLLQQIGTFGVICFFVFSGALTNTKKVEANGLAYFIQKIKGLVIPWIFSATCVFLYVYLRKPPITVSGYLNFLIGNGSYTYYLTELFICYAIFTLLPFLMKRGWCIALVVVTMVSVIFLPNKGIPPYLDITNWIGYFALGILINRHRDTFDCILRKIHKSRYLVYFITVALVVYRVVLQHEASYWYASAPLCAWFGALSLMLYSLSVSQHGHGLSERMILVGEQSFFIYLWHMPIAGIIANIFNRGILVKFVLLRPVVVMFIMMCVVCLLKFVLERNARFSLKILGFFQKISGFR